MRIGRFHLDGSSAWPDHVLSYETGNLIVGVVFQIRSWAFGFEIQGWRDSNPWLNFYLGCWCFEIYWDRDGSWDVL